MNRGSQTALNAYRFGYRQDPIDHRRIPFALRMMRGGLRVPPSSHSNELNAPPVKDQGQTGSCTGHATSGAISLTLRAGGEALPWEPSEAGIYTIARCVSRADDVGLEPLPPLTDDGAEPNEVMRGISEFGVRPSRGPTSDGRNSDAELATINAEPRLDELEEDAIDLLIGEYEINNGPSTPGLVKQAIASGFGVCVGFYVDTRFEEYSGAGELGEPDFTDPNGGGHYVYLVGYRTAADGSLIVHGRNSWGKSWGRFGDFEASQAWLLDAFQIEVLDVRRAP